MRHTTASLQKIAEGLWEVYCEIFPKLVRFDCPKVIINNRFTRTGGVNYSEENKVELAGNYFINNERTMILVTLPHELAHQIDYNLNGWYKGKKHHNKGWIDIMNAIGLIADPYHHMEL